MRPTFFHYGIQSVYDQTIKGKIKQNDFLRIVSIKNPYYSNFMLIPMQKNNSNGNDYLHLAFLAQNGEERSEKNWPR